ncbi:MAG TPA: tyrosine-type recombinase/integrase [Candidatus Aquilonibacter sp.]|nr:tyrosine-type recombinase/integrase [Candidatus Aquilonibacter sp.]
MLFPVAAERWTEWKRPYVLPRTTEAHLTYIQALNRFFFGLPLNEIKPGHLREYQRMRQSNADKLWKRVAGPSAINHELNVLAQILEYAGLWQAIKPYYHPMRMPRWTPRRVMTAEEERRLFEIASTRPEYELAYLVASLTNNTTASGCELRLLQIEHFNLLASPPEILIPSDRVKNNDRGRRIPLNATAAKQAERILRRAARLGAVNRDHYVFPLRTNRVKREGREVIYQYDPTRPASRSWLRKQFVALREEAGVPWLRPHDLRHQAITRLLETGAPDQTVMAVAGHVSRRMMNHYSHIRMDAKMVALNAIEPTYFQPAQPLMRRAIPA